MKFFKKIISSPSRSVQKSRVISKTLNTYQNNNHITNIHRLDTKNAGDYYSAPYHYFENLKDTILDIYDYKSIDNNISDQWVGKIVNNKLLIGGGGLLNRGSFKKQMKLFQKLNEKNKKTVLWGIGHNSKSKKDFKALRSYNLDLSKFGLVGTRDYSLGKNWVPCVSCMHPSFNNPYTPTQEYGFIFHKKTNKKKNITERFKHYPSTSNTTDIKELIEFIGSSEKIITDSYHVMYWSMLMEKKVAVIPNSSKFFDFKYKPEICDFESPIKAVNNATSYTGILEECREINLNFSKKVFDYLNL